MKQMLLKFIKQETVLTIAVILTIISAFFVHPNVQYMGYINWRTLGILLSLMIIMSGFQASGCFDAIGNHLLLHTKNTLQLSNILIFLCFFSSMLITNDVALITFVPFAMITLKKCGQESLLIPVIVLQTVAANLGSMFTPIGNPQNLYLFQLSGMQIPEFLALLFPYTGVSAILLFLFSVLICSKKHKELPEISDIVTKNTSYHKQKTCIYTLLFVLCLLVVADILDYRIVLAVVVITVLLFDKKILKSVDYCLLFTFIAFFLFTGNLGNLPFFQTSLKQFINGREFLTGIVASQCISNVPAALLLSGFTNHTKELLLGVNIGGLGTLIASMASLISYKTYAYHYNETKGKYLVHFTIVNIIFLIILCALRKIIPVF